MNGIYAAVAAAYLYALPLLLAGLGLTSWRRDRLVAGVFIAVAAGFGLVLGLATVAAPLAGPAPALPPGFIQLWPAAVIALGIRLTRDRRQHHIRTAAESIAVLASGAILLAALLSLPVFLAVI